MFEQKKTLIVVYKDELLMNQLKKMIETHDDNGEVVGTRDDSINVVSWTEKVWLGNKDAGNVKGKMLFLDDIKGTENLIPILDVKFDECGVKYGWAGNQAVLYAEPKELADRKAYDAFLQKLSALPVPDFLKTMEENVVNTSVDDSHKPPAEVATESDKEPESGNAPVKAILGFVKRAIDEGTEVACKVGNHVAIMSEELFRDKNLMKRQMLFYGVVDLYYNNLENFMNM